MALTAALAYSVEVRGKLAFLSVQHDPGESLNSARFNSTRRSLSTARQALKPVVDLEEDPTVYLQSVVRKPGIEADYGVGILHRPNAGLGSHWNLHQRPTAGRGGGHGHGHAQHTQRVDNDGEEEGSPGSPKAGDVREIENLHDVAKVVHHHAKQRPIYFTLTLLLMCLSMAVVMIITCCFTAYWRSTQNTWTFSLYLRYHVGNWFTSTPDASAKVLVSIFVLFVLIGAVLYCFFHDERATQALYKVYVWLIAPDAGQAENSVSGQVIGGIMSLVGLLIFALVLTLIQDMFRDFLEELKEGKTPVMETGHVLVVGYTEIHTPLLVKELVHAYSQGQSRKNIKVTIVILAVQAKPDVESSLQNCGVDLQTKEVNVVVRSGCLHDIEALRHVGADTASHIIIAPHTEEEFKEYSDASSLRVLIALRTQGWPTQGKVMLVCAETSNLSLLEEERSQRGAETTSIVMLDSFVSKVMVHCSRGWGLGMAISSVLGFSGSEFYFCQLPSHLKDLPFIEAQLFFPHGVVTGVANKERMELCPRADLRMQEGDELVILADCKKGLEASTEECWEASHEVRSWKRRDSGLRTVTRTVEEHILVFGWNSKMIGPMLLELDTGLHPGDQVEIISSIPTEEREEALELLNTILQRPLKNIKVQHTVLDTASRMELETLKLERATRIFIMCDGAIPAAHQDAYNLVLILNLRSILKKREHECRIIPEVSESRTKLLLEKIDILDYVNSAELQAQVLAMITHEPRVGEILDRITSESGDVEFKIRSLEDYMDIDATSVPSKINFYQAAKMVGENQQVLVGWTKDQCKDVIKSARPAIMNPPEKDEIRNWDIKEDKLIVLTKRGSVPPQSLLPCVSGTWKTMAPFGVAGGTFTSLPSSMEADDGSPQFAAVRTSRYDDDLPLSGRRNQDDGESSLEPPVEERGHSSSLF